MANREVSLRGIPLLDERLVGTKMGSWLEGTGSPFANLRIMPNADIADITHSPIAKQDYITFNGRCSHLFSTPPQLLFMVKQCEQSAMSYRGPLDPSCQIRFMGGNCDGPHPAIPPMWGDGWETIQSKNGWIAWKGQKMLVELCGAGIMGKADQKKRQTEYYLGVDRQIYWTHRIASHWRLAFDDPRERVIQIMNLEGKPENVTCLDPESLYLLRYTPWEKVLTERPRVWKELGMPV